MKITEIREKSSEQLTTLLKEQKEELFNLRFQHAKHESDNPQKTVATKNIIGNILTENDIPKGIRDVFGDTKSKRINSMVNSIINNGTDDIDLTEKDREAFYDLHKFMFKSVYTNKIAKSEEPKVEQMIKTLFEALCENTEKLPQQYKHIVEVEGIERAVADYIGGMTDRYATYIYNELFVPKSWMVF